MRDKRKAPLRLVGKTVVLDEIAPKYFSYVVEWRNNPKLNRYLNQPYILTEDKERDWYENVYLNDDTQGLMIMVDKKSEVPFGTCGWTDLDLTNKRCITGRILRGDDSYKGSPSFYESFFVLGDYLYRLVDVMYAHVVKDNIPSLKLHAWIGYIRREDGFQYAKEKFVNGMEQVEFYRDYDRYVSFCEKVKQEYLGV